MEYVKEKANLYSLRKSVTNCQYCNSLCFITGSLSVPAEQILKFQCNVISYCNLRFIEGALIYFAKAFDAAISKIFGYHYFLV